MKDILSPHGKSLDMAKWVVEHKAPLLNTDEYKNHITMRQWIEQSQQIIDQHTQNEEEE